MAGYNVCKQGLWSRRLADDGIRGLFECLGIEPKREAKV